jgi:hypothetical protein
MRNDQQVFRHRLEKTIEEMIALLDQIDGDPDFEPALGWPIQGPRVLIADAYRDDDRELDDERENDPAEMGIADLDAMAEQAPYFYFDSHAI